uniref:2-(3-amino-3-carboxypropyl)histidine synthase subunit 2 n=1 Tax=Caenorhabditis tropicalis TaxID=1561998 RepID=A0A1I7THW4_9PELO
MTESVPGPFFTTATPSDHIKEESTSNNYYIENLSEKEIHSFFEIDATSEWIKNGRHRRIALQFPDALLPYSERVTQLIENKINEKETTNTEKKTFVLADTSYRSCCVDEVAAAHADCTALVHFGEACHSAPTDKIDVKFVLGNMPAFIEEFRIELQKIIDQLSTDNIVLLMDSCFAHEQKKVAAAIKEVIPNRHIECACLPSETDLKENRKDVYLGRQIPATLRNNLPVDLIFCGFPNSPLLPVWLLSYPSCTTVNHYNPIEKTIQHERYVYYRSY